MSLNSRIKQIAISTVKSYVSTVNTITQTTITNSVTQGSVQAAQVTGINTSDNGPSTYVVSYTDGSTATVAAGGFRPLSPGDCVLISNGAIIG